MIKLFDKKITLYDKIVDHIRDRGDSISGIHRRLEEDGYRLHRLVLTGYLKALTDMGILKETEIKPSKFYSWKGGTKKRDIYSIVGEVVREFGKSDENRAKIAIYILQRLFKRPIFMEELKMCGFKVESIDARKIGGEERTEAKKILYNASVKLPTNDPAFIVDKDNEIEKIYIKLLREIIIRGLDAKRFESKGKQIRFD